MMRGMLIVGSGPSGVGKGTILEQVRCKYPELCYSVSVTTRHPRDGEKDGEDYFFRTREQVQKMIEADELLEYANVFGNYYGTPADYVEKKLSSGQSVLLEIDVQGALKVKSKKQDAVLVFIAPPNLEELERRLKKRKTETEKIIARRLHDARWELSQQDKYDYVVVNDTVDKAVEKFMSILEMEKEKRK